MRFYVIFDLDRPPLHEDDTHVSLFDPDAELISNAFITHQKCLFKSKSNTILKIFFYNINIILWSGPQIRLFWANTCLHTVTIIHNYTE